MTKANVMVYEFYIPAATPPKSRKIPNNLFRTFKSRLVDKRTFEKFSRMREANSAFNFYFFDDNAMDDYMASHWSHRPIFEIYSNLNYGAARADIWRYCILHERGGVYLDFDSDIHFPLDDIPAEVEEIISFERNTLRAAITRDCTPDYDYFFDTSPIAGKLAYPDNAALQWFLAFCPGHKILENTITLIEKRADFFRGRRFASVRSAVCSLTGPIVYTRAVWDYVADGHLVHQQGIDLNGFAVFKDVARGDTYSRDRNRFATKKNEVVLAETKLKLNLGCGGDIRRGWINIDANSLNPRVRQMDISNVADVFEAGTVDEIAARDVLEHVGMPTAIRWLESWSSLLRPGGKLLIQTTCLELIVKAYRWGRIDIDDLNYFLFSGVAWKNGHGSWDAEQTTTYDWHRCCFSRSRLHAELGRNNLVVTAVRKDRILNLRPGNRRHGLNMTFECIKSAARKQL